MKSRIVLIAFLLVLYIGPSLFALSYASPGLPAEPNMTKEFSVADGEGWFDETFRYRKLGTITAGNPFTPQADYQVRIPVTYESNMQSDFDDVVFTDNNGTTLLDFWRESYIASTSAVFWVEIKDDLDSGGTFYMYYGNDAVSDASDGHATFLFYEDWAEQSLDNWTIPAGQTDGQTTWAGGGDHGGYIAKIEGDSADSYIIHSDLAIVAPFATMFRANLEETTAGNSLRVGTGWAGAYGWAFLQGLAGTEVFAVSDDDTNADNQAMDATYYDVWTTFQITRDGTEANLYANDGLIETGSFAPDIISNPVMSFQNIDSEDDIYSDWVAVRKFVPYAEIADEPIFSAFGSEETNFLWQEVGEATIYFHVLFDYWAFDMFLILFGLVLVIASGCYLAHSLKNNMTQDKLFFFVIAFMFGWGLFLGGMLL